MKRFISWKIFAILIVALGLGLYDLPSQAQESIFPFLPKDGAETADGQIVSKDKILLGLDLQGGSQLDYKVDLRKVPTEEQESIVQGVQEVIQRRVNALGVAEPNIYVSDIGGETHIIVELAENGTITQEDVDQYLSEQKNLDELTDDEKKLVTLEKAKATVGKTIQLEFKEQKETLDPDQAAKIKENANAALEKIKNGEDYAIIGQEEEQAYPGKVQYEKSDWLYADELPPKMRDTITSLEIGQYNDELIETGDSFTINEAGQAVEATSLSIIKLVDKREQVRNEKSVDASHLLIAYQGAERADASVTRTKEEAKTLAEEIATKLTDGGDFVELAKEYSDEPGAEDSAGKLPTSISGDGTYVEAFENAALALNADGDISPVTETEFGFHIIRADAVKTDVAETQYKYESIDYSTVPDSWKDTGLTGKQFVSASVQINTTNYQPYVQIQFDSEGADLFSDLTEKNVGKPLAIFVGGDLISAPRVQNKIDGGIAQITGNFTNEEAQTLARELNTGAIPAPIILTGEYTIGATLGHDALTESLKAGAWGLLIVMVFMLLYYRLSGLVANVALSIYAVLLVFLIKSSLPLMPALLLALLIFFYMIMQIINNEDSGSEKFISFILSLVAFFFITFLLKTPVVMTLAGVAGIIFSVGMAVDANILIFERFKEEIRDGRKFETAIDRAFSRAWTAIRDSNFSTLLTCAILFYFGSSIIRGFAFNLATGVLVSMFTAITITKVLMKGFVGRKIAQNLAAFGVREKKQQSKGIKFVRNSKVALAFSGLMILGSIVAISTYGLNLGIDFRGGTLMEFKFEESVSKEQLRNALTTAEESLNTAQPTTNTETIATDDGETPTVITPENTGKVELANATILDSTENSYIVKTEYLTSEQHDQLVAALGTQLPTFTEPRFTTIGPTIGKTLLGKAMIAIGLALILIIIYIGFAFRKVPKSVSPWRFGGSAIAALAHDVIIVTGIFAVLGKVLNVEIDALFITAMLTVFGYSVNDTIVIFDRIRENLLTHRGETLENLTDLSLNQTLARSINTSLSTIVTLVAILLWGSVSIFYFVLALTLGIAVGTYSSLLVASPILVWWNNKAQKK